jgi:uncharacterized membrane protein YczE
MKIEYFKRYLFLGMGLFVMSSGVAFSIKANLGTSPISSVPYVISLIAPITVGQATIAMHCVFILLQVLILRKRYRLIQLLQLPVAFAFGFMTDLTVWLLRGVTCSSYPMQWLLCAAGIALVASGVSMEVAANVVTLAGEGLVLAICEVVPVKFGDMKMCFDIILVGTAVLIGIFAKGALLGVREGTVAAAVLVGLLSKQICRPMAALMDKFIKGVDPYAA